MGIIVFFLISILLSMGLLGSLLIVSRKSLGRNFFRFISTLSLVLWVLALVVYRLGDSTGYRQGITPLLQWRAHIDAAVPWLLTGALLSVGYLLTLALNKTVTSRVFLAAAVFFGAVSLIQISSGSTSRAIPGSIAGIVFPVDFFLSALALGSVVTCMILGHWYLVEPGMSVRPLKTMAGFFLAVILARSLMSAFTSMLIWKDLMSSGVGVQSNLALVDFLFMGQRILFGLVLPIALSWMIWQTVKIRSTQSATGILYVAVVFILFGELLSRYILVTTGYPI